MRHRTFFINGKSTGQGSVDSLDYQDSEVGSRSSRSSSNTSNTGSSSSSSLSVATERDKNREIKCCIVGDEAVGKTAMIVSYLSNGYPEKYTPTVHDCFTVHLTVEDEPVSFQLYDTAGQEHFSVLRRLSYPDADVFMVCFSIIDPYSFKRIQTKWLKELAEYSPHTPIVLVGTKHDQRNNINTKLLLNKHGLKPVTQEQGETFARKIRAKQYIECSALTQRNLKSAFDSALLSGLTQRMIPRHLPCHHHRISPTARLRKSMRRLSLLASRKKLSSRHRDSADSDSSLTSSSSGASTSSASSLSDNPDSTTYSKTFDPERIETQISIKSQLRSMITCFG